MAVQNSGMGMPVFNQSPHACGTSSGTTKNHRNICTSRGMLRTTSTYAVASARSQRSGVVRATPSTEPSRNAMTHAPIETSSVHFRPETSQSR
jgi:hypothetical protein